MSLKIYNSLTKNKEEFIPFNGKNVGMYVCGPTVYSEIHLGNLRTFISFDIIFRYLIFLGYKVRYVRNITDVGHLENDMDEGEDKISKKAKLEDLEPMEISQKYTNDFHYILSKFNCLNPSIEPLATGHILEQIEMIKSILDRGMAYESNGSIYFDVKKYLEKGGNYGILSGRNIDEQLNETRNLEGVTEKKDQRDFALWKKASNEHIMKWKSPWSYGFPGWHLECSAMSSKYLGEKIDIHGGGLDLKFPHHECEIAQNNIFNKNSEIKYWIHANMLTLNGKKMSKSTGNTLLPKELFTKNNILGDGFSPNVVRFFILTAHYRSVLDFSKEALISAKKSLNKIISAYNLLDKIEIDNISDFNVSEWRDTCFNAMNDDFNTSVLIANFHEAVKNINSINDKKLRINLENLNLLKTTMEVFLFDILGVSISEENKEDTHFEDLMEIIIGLRQKLKEDKNWILSDFIREALNSKGIEIKDTKEGTIFNKK